MVRMCTDSLDSFGADKKMRLFIAGETDVVETVEAFIESGEDCQFVFCIPFVKSFIGTFVHLSYFYWPYKFQVHIRN